MVRKHNHYFKDVQHIDTMDVYRVLLAFNVTDPCLQHAVKKLLVAGGRGAKDISRDIREARDTLERWEEMRSEEAVADMLKMNDQDEGRAIYEIGASMGLAVKKLAEGFKSVFQRKPSDGACPSAAPIVERKRPDCTEGGDHD